MDADTSLSKSSRGWLTAAVMVAALSFVAFAVVHRFVVVTEEVSAVQDTASFIVGFSRPNKPPCTAEVSDQECIKLLTFDPAAIRSFWGDRSIQIAELSLTAGISYPGKTSATEDEDKSSTD